ncbi:NAD-dependent protein deacylase sirtuin-6-like [Mytilus californianus]|uniref:NAD-dependent protein deacylase sirtuin-6-like n=1 Tax=Mytilus californianus TaxID=6549 RepID=UPI0022483251|nr:NAD-dependent protein deacylase sirtuin-6-like [Mytilus californianus]
MSTASENMICSFAYCDQGHVIPPWSARVDVRGFHVPKSKRKGMVVDWTDDGSASLHVICWQKVCELAQGKSPNIKLCKKEKDLINEAEQTVEFHDSEECFQKEASRIAALLRDSAYCIGFTGAGISTAAGIGDYRGIHGQWTNNDKTKEYGPASASFGLNVQSQRDYLLPTYTHEAIYKLMDMGLIKYLISQNTDGLHKLSGIPSDKISELHGNGYEEKCDTCGSRHMRRQSTVQHLRVPPQECCSLMMPLIPKKTGCNGYLMNTIINFGDILEEFVYSSAKENGEKADAVICLGTTLLVSPADELVTLGKKPNRLVICNRQSTPYDDYCTQIDERGEQVGSRVYGDCDRLMKLVMGFILGEDHTKEWEDERDQRIALYDMTRT